MSVQVSPASVLRMTLGTTPEYEPKLKSRTSGSSGWTATSVIALPVGNPPLTSFSVQVTPLLSET